MTNTVIGLLVFSLVGTAAMLWRKKRRYERKDRPRRYWDKVKADTLDSALLGIGYIGLFGVIVALVLLDPSLLVWLFLALVLVSWLRVRR